MLRRLMTCAVLTYLAYQLFELLAEESAGRVGGARRRALKRALNEDEGRMNFTGPGRGTTVEAEDPDGARAIHAVGRGVVS